MKKLFILAMLILPFACFAQRTIIAHSQPIHVIDQTSHSVSNPGMKTTTAGDTVTLKNINDTATLTVYTLSTNATYGYVTGTDTFGDQGFAERYDFNGGDSSVSVIGVYALFGGTVNPASTKTVTFGIWDQSAPVAITDTLVYSGYPYNILDTISVPVTQIGIGTTSDTLKAYLFTYPTGYIGRSFFAGYTIGYNFSTLNGDTIGLAASLNGDRTSALSTLSLNVSGTDTTIITTRNVQNATMQSDYSWYDNYYQNDSLANDLAIYPIVVIGASSDDAVKGVTRNNLTFFGNYPNPAVNSTNIKFSLLAGADVTIQVMDMSGRTLNTIKQNNLATGQHIVPVNTSGMPAGDYLYLIHTSGGDAIGGKMTVIR